MFLFVGELKNIQAVQFGIKLSWHCVDFIFQSMINHLDEKRSRTVKKIQSSFSFFNNTPLLHKYKGATVLRGLCGAIKRSYNNKLLHHIFSWHQALKGRNKFSQWRKFFGTQSWISVLHVLQANGAFKNLLLIKSISFLNFLCRLYWSEWGNFCFLFFPFTLFKAVFT